LQRFLQSGCFFLSCSILKKKKKERRRRRKKERKKEAHTFKEAGLWDLRAKGREDGRVKELRHDTAEKVDVVDDEGGLLDGDASPLWLRTCCQRVLWSLHQATQREVPT